MQTQSLDPRARQARRPRNTASVLGLPCHLPPPSVRSPPPSLTDEAGDTETRWASLGPASSPGRVAPEAAPPAACPVAPQHCWHRLRPYLLPPRLFRRQVVCRSCSGLNCRTRLPECARVHLHWTGIPPAPPPLSCCPSSPAFRVLSF